MRKNKILVSDFGGHQAQNVARAIRKNKIYSEIYPYRKTIENITEETIAIVLVGNREDRHDKIYNEIISKNLDVLDLTNEELDERKLINYLDSLQVEKNWTMEKYKDYCVELIQEKVKDGKVILAMSGGVDSSVCAKLISEAIGDQLTCIFVDTGLMRKYETKEVEDAFKDSPINLIFIDGEKRFLDKLKDVVDPEKKRKIIGEEFIQVFEEEGKKIGTVDFLAQGTIYSDVIESGDDDNQVIKSHHNVGGLPDVLDFKDLLEPLRYLFKDEVREMGLELGLSEDLVWRQPFPGPGLAVRIKGDITKSKLEILRDADYIFREEIKNAGLSRDINQYFAVLTNIQSVGNKDGKRTYDYTIALRAVVTKDFMTAVVADIPFPVLQKISSRITDEVEGVNRVVYDISDKPPATIEWE